MAKSYNQKGKILYLERILQRTGEDHTVSMQEILDELTEQGISAERKSIYDDMEVLRSFGMDIQYKRGKPGGYYLAGEGKAHGAAAPARETSRTQLQEEEKQIKLLCEEAVRCGRDDHYRILPSGICTYKAYHPSWRYGGRKCEDVFPDDGLDHSSKASCMGGILYSGLWYACCRGCEIFHDHFLCKHVGVQVLLMCISDPCYGYGTTGCMVGNVYRLDHPWDYFYLAVPQQEVAEA